MSIIDTPFNTESRIPCLLSQGIRTVIRYYNFSNSRRLPEKRMELAEAQALAAHGMQIAVVFQQSQNQVIDFTELKGVTAGRRAYRYAQDNIGQPAGSGIYFSVDFDASTNEIENNIARYFEGVKHAFAEESRGNPEYRGVIKGEVKWDGSIYYIPFMSRCEGPQTHQRNHTGR